MHILRQSELDGMPCPDTLIHADCLEAMKHIADGSVDAIIADLPYGTTNLKWDSVIPLEPLWEAYKRIIKPNGAIVLFGSEPFSSHLRLSNIKWFKYDWIWSKDKPNNFANANIQPMKYHEIISVFYASQPTYNKQMIERTGSGAKRCKTSVNQSNQKSEHYTLKGDKVSFYDPNLKNPSSILSITTGSRQNSQHPTQKPVALCENLMNTYTNPGDLVLDNVMGSGTLPVACLNTGRHFIGIEKDDSYFAASVERVKAALAQLSLCV